MLSVYGKVRFVVNKDMINTRGEETPLAKKSQFLEAMVGKNRKSASLLALAH
jgi:hypothetical protein